MTTFDDRASGFESKFAFDEETEFKVVSRRNRLLGTWAGGLLGKTGEALEAYALTVIRSDFAEAGDADVLAKVTADLEGHVTGTEIRAKMDSLLDHARTTLQSGT